MRCVSCLNPVISNLGRVKGRGLVSMYHCNFTPVPGDLEPLVS